MQTDKLKIYKRVDTVGENNKYEVRNVIFLYNNVTKDHYSQKWGNNSLKNI